MLARALFVVPGAGVLLAMSTLAATAGSRGAVAVFPGGRADHLAAGLAAAAVGLFTGRVGVMGAVGWSAGVGLVVGALR